MSNHLGINTFAAVCNQFRTFSNDIVVPTTQCKAFITGGPSADMNYVYQLEIRDEQGFKHDMALLNFKGSLERVHMLQ